MNALTFLYEMRCIQKMRRKCLLASALAACFFATQAQSFRSVKVLTTDGSSVIVEGERDLKARFSGDDLIFEACGWTLLSIPVEEVRGWQLTDERNMKDDFGLRISFRDGRLQVTGVPDGSRVTVHSLSGLLMADEKVAGVARIDLRGFTTGAYLGACEGKCFKIYVP